MDDPKIRKIYYTLAGELQEPHQVPGVDNLYAAGSPLCRYAGRL